MVFITLNSNLLVEAQEASDSVVVRRASGKIIIDGNLDEPDWQNAQLVGPFLIYPTRNPEENELTHAKILWDEKTLYIAFKSYDTNIVATRMERNIDVWRFNLYRLARKTEPARRNLFYLPEPLNNHSPEYFGKLIFSEETWINDE